MTPHGRRIAQATVWVTVLVALTVAVASSGPIRKLVVEAARNLDVSAVLVMLPVQLASAGLCALALRAFAPGVSFWGCLGSRFMRDAAGNLPFVPPGTSEAAGARALVLAGGGTRQAIVASTLDKTAEILAQVPYIMLAVWLLFRGWQPTWNFRFRPEWVLAALLVAVIAVAIWLRFGARSAFAARLREEWHKLIDEVRSQRSGMPASIVLHFIAWLMGGVQVWLAALALGYDIGLFEAIAIESAAYAGRAVLFFIPAGLVAQEAGLVAAGLLFGLSPAQSLALGLAMRVRDLVFGLPLLAWPLFEMRRQRSVRS